MIRPPQHTDAQALPGDRLGRSDAIDAGREALQPPPELPLRQFAGRRQTQLFRIPPKQGHAERGDLPRQRQFCDVQPLGGALATGYAPRVITRLADGRLLIAGGSQAVAVAGQLNEIIAASVDGMARVSGTGDLIWRRVGHTATLLADRRELAAGGSTVGEGAPELARMARRHCAM